MAIRPLVILLCFGMVCCLATDLTCPPPTLIPVCEKTCTQDSECADPQDEKCCPTECGGTLCQRAVTARHKYPKVKDGTCPAKPSGAWICSNMCKDDRDCHGKKKCCLNRCHARVCTEPESNEVNDGFAEYYNEIMNEDR